MAITTALKKVQTAVLSGARYVVVDGGTGAGKTYDIICLIIGYCESFPASIFSVLGKSHKHLERGAIRDFRSNMNETGRWEQAQWNESKSVYTFQNGSILEFISADDMDAHGPKRTALFVNEANAVKWSVFDQLATRTSDLVILDFNPSAEFWAHTELLNKRADRTTHVTLTYKDNEALTEDEIANIEEHAPKPGEKPSNWWLVYGLGQLGSPEGNIYDGWLEVSEEAIQKDAELVRYGLDFGFGHPTGLVELWAKSDGSIGIVERIYKSGINSSEYPKILMSHNIDPAVLIVADSARPEIIADIKRAGFRIVGANKDAGSVQRGISRVQERKVYYCGDGLRKEYLSYKWREKRSTGETIYEPVKADDDLMDALRYAVDDYVTPPKFSF